MDSLALADALVDAWKLPRPLRIVPLTGGTNNLVFRVMASSGAYVLSLAGNHASEGRLRFTQTVLTQLQTSKLPFAVPVCIPTAKGALTAQVELDGHITLATLTSLIPGATPRRGDDLAQTLACGEALGIVDAALALVVLTDEAMAREANSWRSSGDLARTHLLVPDPLEGINSLPVEEEIRQRLADSYVRLMERIPALYASLPQQLCHEDYDPSNVLVEGERVTGVLDWEFCSRDLRVMDVVVPLTWWPLEQFGSGDEWSIIHAFLRGYAQALRLTPEECEAIPLLFHLRAYTSLIHRLGRYRQGISPREAVIARAHAALEREEWLRANASQLAQVACDEMR
ncbi:MAG TPA: phosphotransferase [Ktedonobacterales bacterium]|nr:phosphotransferase [Ktedonobacterales bacterium]